MQKADVLVTVHGAELSNALFLRRNARLIELMPFGGSTTYFKIALADRIHARHIAYATDPDPERFYKCVEKYEMNRLLAEALDVYNRHKVLFGEAKNEMQRQKAGLFHVGHGSRQKCIKSQMAGSNPHALAGKELLKIERFLAEREYVSFISKTVHRSEHHRK